MKTLVSTVAMKVTPLHLDKLRLIDQEDFSGVVRKVREELEAEGFEPTTEWLAEGALALKQYYAIALLDPVNRHAVSDVIDPFWHAHILHTKQYVAFCDEVFGEYIHHEPLDHSKPEDVAVVRRLYDYTYLVYGQMFSYVNPEFFAEALPTQRLLCSHNRVNSAALRAVALLPAHAMAI